MKVLNLGCTRQHRFEGWFAGEDDFVSQRSLGLLECPMCADKSITRLPSAPRLNVSGAREPGGSSAAAAAATVEAPNDAAMQAAWLRAVQHVISNTDDVGERFAEEARRIHYGETDPRSIRGRATRDEAQALHDEGIDVMALPLPAAIKGPVQ